MLDQLTKKIMDSFHRNAQNTIIPMREAVKKNVNTQISLGSGALKLGTMILLFFGILKMSDRQSEKPKPEIPSTIVINNYIQRGEAEPGK